MGRTAGAGRVPAGLAYNGATYVYTAREVDPNGGRPVAGPPLRSFLYTSTDALTWTRHDVPIEGVMACNGRFIAGGSRTSPDNGYPDGTFLRDQPATRAKASALLSNLLQR